MPAPLRAALLLALALPIAAPVRAGGPQCPAGYADDLGHGLVDLYREGRDATGAHVAGTALVTHCASGRSIVLKLPLHDEINAFETARWIVREALGSGGRVTLDDLRDRLDDRVGPALLDGDDAARRESCACALFYPDLRGDKTPWQE